MGFGPIFRVIEMHGNTIYVPHLKAKEGEFRGYSNLDESVRKSIVPFFDIPQNAKDDIYIILDKVIKNVSKFIGKKITSL